MEERWEIRAGVAGFRVRDVEQTVGVGEVVVAPPGVSHIGWNASEEPVHVRIELRPALRWAELVERLFDLAEQGLTDETGTPEPALLGDLLREFRREIAPASPAV